jgi:Mrp family chromosome partitioning ATPase
MTALDQAFIKAYTHQEPATAAVESGGNEVVAEASKPRAKKTVKLAVAAHKPKANLGLENVLAAIENPEQPTAAAQKNPPAASSIASKRNFTAPVPAPATAPAFAPALLPAPLPARAAAAPVAPPVNDVVSGSAKPASGPVLSVATRKSRNDKPPAVKLNDRDNSATTPAKKNKNTAIESQNMNIGRATNGSPDFQAKMNELPDIDNLKINKPAIAPFQANVLSMRTLLPTDQPSGPALADDDDEGSEVPEAAEAEEQLESSIKGAAEDADEPSVSDAVETDENAQSKPPATVCAEPPFKPMLQVDRYIWPPVCIRLISTATAELSSIVEAITATKDQGIKTLTIAGCRRGEGGTTLLLCVARGLAERGLRVAIVDADLADPQIAGRLGLQPQFGWDTVLDGLLPLSEVVIEAADNRVGLLPLHEPLVARKELAIQRSTLTDACKTLAATYDLVLIDIGSLEDFLGYQSSGKKTISPLEAAIIVQDDRATSADDLKEMENRLSLAGIQPLGVVQNLVQPGSSN